jgi:hypothetical protein
MKLMKYPVRLYKQITPRTKMQTIRDAVRRASALGVGKWFIFKSCIRFLFTGHFNKPNPFFRGRMGHWDDVTINHRR